MPSLILCPRYRREAVWTELLDKAQEWFTGVKCMLERLRETTKGKFRIPSAHCEQFEVRGKHAAQVRF